MSEHKISIIVATYNEEANIGRLLKSCLDQTYPNLEIVVVDSQRSTDKTYQIAKEFTPKVYKYGNERSAQRNYGVSKAGGKYICVLDSDMQPDPEVVKDCVRAISVQSVKSVIIPEKSFGENYWAKCKALERNCYIGDPAIEAPRFFSKSDFIEAGGYDVSMVSGEDWDLGRRLKLLGTISRIAPFIHHNEGNITLLKTIQKKLYYSQNATPYLEKNVSGMKDVILFVFRPAYFRNWKVLLSDPIHFFGFIIMKSMELMVGSLAIIKNQMVRYL